MSFLLALSLYGGAFFGYCLGDTKVLQEFTETTMEDMAKESQEYIAEQITFK